MHGSPLSMSAELHLHRHSHLPCQQVSNGYHCLHAAMAAGCLETAVGRLWRCGEPSTVDGRWAGNVTVVKDYSTGRLRDCLYACMVLRQLDRSRQAGHTCRGHGTGECPPIAPEGCRWQSPQPSGGAPGCMRNMPLPVALPYMHPANASTSASYDTGI